jgi:hypothetical protein
MFLNDGSRGIFDRCFSTPLHFPALTHNGTDVWMDGFININDMYNNAVGKRGVRLYEAYEVK